MNESFSIIEWNLNTDIRDIVDFMRNNHLKLLKSEKFQMKFFEELKRFYDLKQKSGENKNLSDINNVFLFFSTLFKSHGIELSKESIKQEIILEKDRGLYYTNILLICVFSRIICVDDKHTVGLIRRLFESSVTNIRDMCVGSFYSLNICYFLSNFYDKFTIMNVDITEHVLKNIDPASLKYSMTNYNNIFFISEILNIVSIQSGDSRIGAYFENLFEIDNINPSLILKLYFPTWIRSIKNCIFEPTRRQIENVSNMFDKMCVMKYHEMQNNFPWTEILWLYDIDLSDKQRITLYNILLNSAVFTNKNETIQFNTDVLPDFAKQKRIAQICNNSSGYWPLFAVFSYLHCLLSKLVFRLKKIRAPLVNPSDRSIKTIKLFFSDQPNLSNITRYNDSLFSIIPVEIFSDYDNANRYWDKQNEIFETVLSKMNLLKGVFREILPIAISKYKDKTREEVEIQKVMLHYFLILYSSWMEFLILIYHSYVSLHYYRQLDVNFFSQIQSLFHKAVQTANELPLSFFSEFFTSVLEKHHKLGNVTLPFISCYEYIFVTQPASFNVHLHIVSKLMETSYSKLNIFSSISSNLCESFSNWFFLVLRISLLKFPDKASAFQSISSMYFKPIVYGIINKMRWYTNQTVALKLAEIIIDAKREISAHTPNCKDNHSVLKIRYYHYDYIVPPAQNLGAKVFLKYFKIEQDNSFITNYHSAFETAMKSNDPELISLGLEFCREHIIKDKKNNKWNDNSNEKKKEHIQLYFESLMTSSISDAKETIKDIALLSPLFCHSHTNENIRIVNMKIDDIGFDLCQILTQVWNNHSESLEYFVHIFMLLTCSFEFLTHNIFASREAISPIFKICIYLYCRAFSFEQLNDTLYKYSSYLNNMFAYHMCSGISDLYFLSLLDILGFRRCEMAKIAIEICISFLEVVRTLDPSVYVIESWIEHLLSSFQPQTHLFSILTGLSLVNRFFPGSVNLVHLRAFLIQLTDIHYIEDQFYDVLREFIDHFLKNVDYNVQFNFVQMVYEISCPLASKARQILAQASKNLGIKIHIESIDSQYSEDRSLMFTRATLIIECGTCIEYDLPNVIARFVPILNGKIDDMPRTVEFLYSICKDRSIIIVLAEYENKALIGFMLNVICHALSFSNPIVNKIAKKCLYLLTQYQNEVSYFNEIYEYCTHPENIFQPFGNIDRVIFYYRLMKIIPSNIPVSVIVQITNAIVEFDQMSDIEKYKYISNLQFFIKALTVKDYMTSNDVVKVLFETNEQGTSIYRTIVITLLRILGHCEIPFRVLLMKSISKFVKIFPNQIFQLALEQSDFHTALWLLLSDVMTHYDNKDLITSFLSIANDLNPLELPPDVFYFLECLVSNNSYANDQEIHELLTLSLSKLYNECTSNETISPHKFQSLIHIIRSLICSLKFFCDVKLLTLISNSIFMPVMYGTDTFNSFFSTLFDLPGFDIISSEFILHVINNKAIDPVSFSVILSKVIENITTEDAAKIWILLLSVSLEDYIHYGLAKIIYALSKKSLPSDLSYLLNTFCYKGIESSDTCTFIYTIKILTSLSKQKLLPKKLFIEVSELILAYDHFFEPPYLKHVTNFLNSNQSILREISPRILPILSHYFLNTSSIDDLYRSVLKSKPLFLNVPICISIVPFSYGLLVTDLLRQNSGEFSRSLFNLSLELYSTVLHDCPVSEFQTFVDICDEYLNNLSFDQVDDPRTTFCTLLISYNKKLIIKAVGKDDNCYRKSIEYISVMFKHSSELEIIDSYDQIKNIIFNIDGYNTKKINDSNNFREFAKFIEVILKRIFDSEELYNIFTDDISNMFEIFKSNEQYIHGLVVLCVESYLTGKQNSTDRLMYLIKLIPYYTNTYTSIILEDIINFIHRVPEMNVQVQIINTLLTVCSVGNSLLPEYLCYFSFLLKSENIVPFVKVHLERNLISLVKNINNEAIESIYQTIMNNSTEISNKMKISLIYAKQASPTKRILALDMLRKMMPCDSSKSICLLFKVFDPEYWENDFLPLLISLVAKKTRFWYPIFALSDLFVSIGSDLVSETFIQIMNDTNVHDFSQFYLNLIKVENKLNISNILSAFQTSFFVKMKKLPCTSILKSLKYSGEFSSSWFHMTPSLITQTFLLTHRLNDTTYGILRSMLNLQESAELALYFLGHYNSSAICASDTKCKTMLQIRQLNNAFININQPRNYLEALQPIIETSYKFRPCINEIINAASMIAKNQSKAEEILNVVENFLVSFIRGRRFLSLYDRECLTVLENIIYTIRNYDKEGINFSYTNEIYCINPHLYKVIVDFSNIFNDTGLSPSTPSETGGEYMFLVMPSMKYLFSSVVGYTINDLVAVGKSQVNEYLNNISEQEALGKMTVSGWQNASRFCYNLFVCTQTFELFQTVYSICSRILCSQIGIYHKQESASKLITLTRYAINTSDKKYWDVISKYKRIFSIELADVWGFWLQQIVEMSANEWFFDIVSHLFENMSYRSSLYGKKLGIQYFMKIYQKSQSELPTQIQMMNQILIVMKSFTMLNFEEFTLQKHVYQLAFEASKMIDDLDNINLIELRKKEAYTPLEKALHNLSLDEISKLDLKELASVIKTGSLNEISDVIQKQYNTTSSLYNNSKNVQKSIIELNKNLPFIFPIKFESALHIYIIRVHEEIEFLSDDIRVIFATTSTSPRQAFLIQLSTDEKGFHPSVLTLSYVFIFFKKMLNMCYQSRTRNIHLNATQIFEIGENMCLTSLPSDGLLTFEHLFKSSVMQNSREWYDINVTDGKLNEKGVQAIKQLKQNTLSKFMLRELHQKSLSDLKIHILRSFAASGVVQYLYESVYPDLNHLIICYRTGNVVLVHKDFDYSENQKKIGSNFRLSPNILHSMGHSGYGEFELAMVSTGYALLSNLESFRSYTEVFVSDKYKIYSIDEIKSSTDVIINRLLRISPPVCARKPDDCIEWLSYIEHLIEKASDPNIQPPECIPWF